MKQPLFFIAIGLALTGCASYGCPAPGGVTCKPISEVYQSLESRQNGVDDSAPEGAVDKKKKGESPARAGLPSGRRTLPSGAPSAETGAPVRSAPQLRRVLINKWIDEEGDYHREEEILMETDRGRWILGLPSIDPDAGSRLGVLAPNPPSITHPTAMPMREGNNR